MKKLLATTIAGAAILGATIMTSTSVNAACSGIYNHQFTTLQGLALDEKPHSKAVGRYDRCFAFISVSKAVVVKIG